MASLLEQYESMYQTGDDGTRSSQPHSSSVSSAVSRDKNGAISSKNEGIINLRSDNLEPIFTKNKIDFRPSHGITHMVVSNNQLLLSMDNCHLLKIDLINPSKPTEIDLNPYMSGMKSPMKPIICGLFIDPSGHHCLISVAMISSNAQTNSYSLDTPSKASTDSDLTSGLITPFENFYYNRKLSTLTKTKGHLMTAIGWIPIDLNGIHNNVSCGNFLVGTNDGRVFETHVQSDDRFLTGSRAECSFWKAVCDLSGSDQQHGQGFSDSTIKSIGSLSSTRKDPICAIHCFRLKESSPNQFSILIATRNFIYQYLGEIRSQTSLVVSTNQQQSLSTFDGQPYLYQIIQNSSQQKSFREMPGYIPFTQLDLFYPTESNYPKSFGWLTEPGIFYGEIADDLGKDLERKMFDEASVIMYNDLVESSLNKSLNRRNYNDNYELMDSGTNQQQIPMSLILTKFHLLLLYPSKLKIVCVLNREVILEDRFLSEPAEGIVKDPIRNTIWSYTKHSVYRYKINQEDRNIWQIHLKNKDFDSARRYAKNDLIKMDKTICEEALYYFIKKDYKRSAHLFTQTRSKSFEEIVLKFIELHDKNQEALKEFLLNKLNMLSPVKERTQIIILLIWLFEILLNELSTLQNEINDSSNQNEKHDLKLRYNQIESSLKNLISNANYKAIHKKNKHVIYNLILNHDNSNIYEYFAQQIEDFGCLMEHYCQRGEYVRALSLLRREECLDLYYQYCPILIQHLPDQLIDCLIPLASQLDFAKLIPSLVHFDHSNDSIHFDENVVDKTNEIDERRESQCKEILRFLEFCVYNLGSRHGLIHNYLLALLAQYQPSKLITYLNNVSTFGGQPNSSDEPVPYNLGYAARICMQCKVPTRAIVQLLNTMGAFEEAVEQALSVNDVELAKQTADKVQTFINEQQSGSACSVHQNHHDLAKRLWLKIAKHVIKNIYSNNYQDRQTILTQTENKFDISMATSILNECSLLKIEDILPYFPEYLTIDHFKEAICQSLEDYNRHIESLRDDMKLATESAQQIRQEITRVRNSFTIIDSSDPCRLCSMPALQEHFYSFSSCGHLFHHKCLVQEIVDYLPMDDRIKLEAMLSESKSIQNQLQTMTIMFMGSQATNNSVESMATSRSSISITNRLENLNSKIEDLIGSECLLCGNLMIQTIDKPFIDQMKDRDELIGWN